MSKWINVLSNFDWMSVWMVALLAAKVKVNRYFASEVDKKAIQVSKENYPEIEHIWDIKNISYNNKILHYWENSCISPIKIDLVIWWSPCQWFSRAWNWENFKHEWSKLFFEFVRTLEEVKKENEDVKFLLENVNMKKERQDVITKLLWVEPIKINSNLFLPHNRPRLYWTNIPFNRNIQQKEYKLSEILDQNVDEKYYISNEIYDKVVLAKGKDHLIIRNWTQDWKWYLVAYPWDCVNVSFPTSTTRRSRVKKGVIWCQTTSKSECILEDDLRLRYMTRNEVERSQWLKVWFTKSASESQCQKMCGNGWTRDVIEYFFNYL